MVVHKYASVGSELFKKHTNREETDPKMDLKYNKNNKAIKAALVTTPYLGPGCEYDVVTNVVLK